MEMTTPSHAVFRENFEPQKLLGLPDATYRKFRAISKSGLDLIDLSPAHYRYEVIDGNRGEPTAAMILGSAFDSFLLTPDQFRKDYVVAPNIRRGTKGWEEFESSNPGRTILKQEDFEAIQAMRESVLDHPVARGIFSLGDSQVSYKWQDPLTGVICKSRADFVRADNVMIDLKTTLEGGAKPETFGRTAYNMRYHVQAAFYSDGAAIVEKAPEAFIFVVVERVAPYPVAVYHVDEGLLAAGRETYQRNLETYAICYAENRWPAYPTDIQKLTLPSWAKV